MRFVLYLILIGSFAALPSRQLRAQNPDVQQIKSVLAGQSAAWNKGDLQAFMQPYWHSDSLMFVGKDGVTYGWQPTLDRYKKTYPGKAAMGQLTFNLLEFKPLAADVYLVIGKWHLKRTIGNLQGHFSILLRKIDGEWNIIADHSS
ncbi:YybH family protein [Chitinophaga solisilvae]|uniref:YybH family protein n=1 Tax=Chitinophaga solisilvae TaxID=1233460 RepID=UPI001371F8AE|nr:nuclear transport factor 2 family protein [Chitinophaga solisilvae]